MSNLEEKVKLSNKEKDYLNKEFEKIYKRTQKEAVPDMLRFSLGTPDLSTINYSLSLSDYYLGKFFQGDEKIRRDVISWMNKYYLSEGNPIGKDQTGIKEFLNQFGEYLKQRTENKTRQIIDTTYNHLKNSARVRAFQKARITYYKWDATGDRRTCPYCRAMDGRTFRTVDAVRTLDLIETDPASLPELKPFLTNFDLHEIEKLPSDDMPSKIPPAHPHCRCTLVASVED